jgi:hypothetical protein
VTEPIGVTGLAVQLPPFTAEAPACTTDVLDGALTHAPVPVIAPAGLLGHSPSANVETVALPHVTPVAALQVHALQSRVSVAAPK